MLLTAGEEALFQHAVYACFLLKVVPHTAWCLYTVLVTEMSQGDHATITGRHSHIIIDITFLIIVKDIVIIPLWQLTDKDHQVQTLTSCIKVVYNCTYSVQHQWLVQQVSLNNTPLLVGTSCWVVKWLITSNQTQPLQRAVYCKTPNSSICWVVCKT